MYNFDEVIDRKNSDCLKYGVLEERWHRTDLLPLWVADMDFRTPDFVIKALRNRLDHEILGYTATHPQWRASIIDWLKKRHNYEVAHREITFIPGIVRGIAFVLQAFTQKDDKVMVFAPVYHPFFIVAGNNKRTVVRHELVLGEDNRYYIDFDKLAQDIKGVKVLILSNPHNPGGRVWTQGELEKIAHICKENGVLVISDEIHADLTLAPHKHIPFATVSDEAREISITFGSPSKAFNTPGIVTSYSIIHNTAIRNEYKAYLQASELDEGNMFAQLVTVTAYTQGAQWLEEVKQYIQDNINFVVSYLEENIPQIKPMVPEASYLIYLNCRDLGISHEQLLDLFIDKAHLALDDGSKFGPEGKGFMRLNVGTPRAILKQALDQLKEAIER
ncbi:MAG: MalY/PatB family protein [Bacteroidia bacterium]|nr:MalY/PatB family protein [Bacteroidia bacterium]